MEPVICSSIEVARDEENLLWFDREEFGTAEEVMTVLREVEVELVSILSEHVRRGYLHTLGLWEGLWW